MLHARKDYNERIQDNANLIPGDEPVFLLRGQDEYAPNALRAYADSIEADDENQSEVTMNLVETVRKHANAMETWQDDRFVKTPDMPENTSIYANEPEPRFETSDTESKPEIDDNN